MDFRRPYLKLLVVVLCLAVGLPPSAFAYGDEGNDHYEFEQQRQEARLARLERLQRPGFKAYVSRTWKAWNQLPRSIFNSLFSTSVESERAGRYGERINVDELSERQRAKLEALRETLRMLVEERGEWLEKVKTKTLPREELLMSPQLEAGLQRLSEQYRDFVQITLEETGKRLLDPEMVASSKNVEAKSPLETVLALIDFAKYHNEGKDHSTTKDLLVEIEDLSNHLGARLGTVQETLKAFLTQLHRAGILGEPIAYVHTNGELNLERVHAHLERLVEGRLFVLNLGTMNQAFLDLVELYNRSNGSILPQQLSESAGKDRNTAEWDALKSYVKDGTLDLHRLVVDLKRSVAENQKRETTLENGTTLSSAIPEETTKLIERLSLLDRVRYLLENWPTVERVANMTVVDPRLAIDPNFAQTRDIDPGKATTKGLVGYLRGEVRGSTTFFDPIMRALRESGFRNTDAFMTTVARGAAKINIGPNVYCGMHFLTALLIASLAHKWTKWAPEAYPNFETQYLQWEKIATNFVHLSLFFYTNQTFVKLLMKVGSLKAMAMMPDDIMFQPGVPASRRAGKFFANVANDGMPLGLTIVMISALHIYYGHPDHEKIEYLDSIGFHDEAQALYHKVLRESWMNSTFFGSAAADTALFALGQQILRLLTTGAFYGMRALLRRPGGATLPAGVPLLILGAAVYVSLAFTYRVMMPVLIKNRIRTNLEERKEEYERQIKLLSDRGALLEDVTAMTRELGIEKYFATDEKRAVLIKSLLTGDLNRVLLLSMSDSNSWTTVAGDVSAKLEEVTPEDSSPDLDQQRAAVEKAHQILDSLADPFAQPLLRGSAASKKDELQPVHYLQILYLKHLTLNMLWASRQYKEFQKECDDTNTKYPGLLQHSRNKNNPTTAALYPFTNRFLERFTGYQASAELVDKGYDGYRDFVGLEEISKLDEAYVSKQAQIEEEQNRLAAQNQNYFQGSVHDDWAEKIQLIVALFGDDQVDQRFLQTHRELRPLITVLIGRNPFIETNLGDPENPYPNEVKAGNAIFENVIQKNPAFPLLQEMARNAKQKRIDQSIEDELNAPDVMSGGPSMASMLIMFLQEAMNKRIRALGKERLEEERKNYWETARGHAEKLALVDDNAAVATREHLVQFDFNFFDNKPEGAKTASCTTKACLEKQDVAREASTDLSLDFWEQLEAWFGEAESEDMQTNWSSLYTSQMGFWWDQWISSAADAEIGGNAGFWVSSDQRQRFYNTYFKALERSFLMRWVIHNADPNDQRQVFETQRVDYIMKHLDAIDPPDPQIGFGKSAIFDAQRVKLKPALNNPFRLLDMEREKREAEKK